MSYKTTLLSKRENNLKKEASFQKAAFSHVNQTLSIVIRCHKIERLDFLDKALFSLAVQYWQDLEIIVVIQNGASDFEKEVRRLFNSHPFSENTKFKVRSVKIADGVDGRSALLNHGIKCATGRYLAFLDDDDVVYQHGYTTLISQLTSGSGAVALGGCRVAKLEKKSDCWYVAAKETPFLWGRSRFDLYKDNFVPIHSYVIDRAQIKTSDLYFDEKMHLLEDYDFLLRLSAKYEFDFSKLNVFVCEYRMHGDNSLPLASAPCPERLESHLKALEVINERKKNLACAIPIADLLDLLNKTPRPVENIQISDDNLRVFSRILNVIETGVYGFFRNHPKIEKRLSNVARYGWVKYSKQKTS